MSPSLYFGNFYAGNILAILGRYAILIPQNWSGRRFGISHEIRETYDLNAGNCLNVMAEKKDHSYWFIFSIMDVIFITVLVIVLGQGGNLLGGADVGFHIRAGEYIMDNFTIPTHDIFSSSTPPLPWTPPEWLAEVIFSTLYKPFGLTSVVVFMVFVIAAIYAILFKFLRSSGVRIIVAALIVVLAAGASAIHWLARPHVFSLLILLIWYIILDTYQYQRKNYLYLLPFLMLLWVNLHGSFVMGFILLIVYIAGNFLKAGFAKEERQESSGRTKVFILFFFLCLLASLLNPQGYKILFSPFEVANSEIMEHVYEWMSPNFHLGLIYEYLLLIMILVLGVSAKRLNIIEVMLVLLFTHMSLFSARFIPLYAIIISPILGKQIDRIIEDLKGKGFIRELISTSDNMATVDSKTKWHLWSVAAMAVVIFMCLTGRISYHFDRNKMPVDAVEFLKSEKIEGKVFNDDVFGSYMIYAAWPDYEVFFDGRDMYGKERTEDYLMVTGLERGWEDVLKKYDITWIIYHNKSALSNLLLERDDWQLIYSDEVANIFVKRTQENQPLIDKYPNVKPVAAGQTEDQGK
jgi:hypothetical protein